MVESCALVSVQSVAGDEGHTCALVSVSGLVFNGVLKGDLKGCESVRDALSSRRRFDGCRCVMACSKCDGEHSLDQFGNYAGFSILVDCKVGEYKVNIDVVVEIAELSPLRICACLT